MKLKPKAIDAQSMVTPPSSVAKQHPEKHASASKVPGDGSIAGGRCCHVTRSTDTA